MNKTAPKQADAEPTSEEIAAAARTLSRLRPGFLPLPIFLETTRLTVSSIIEIVPLRMKSNNIQVLLTKRDKDDPTWPGMVHTPGTVVRPTDKANNYADAFERILGGELATVELAGEPQYVGSFLHKSKRGMEDANVFFVEITGEPRAGEFYDVAALPDTIVDSQIDFIHAAAKKFTKEHQSKFGDDPLDEYSKPVSRHATKLAKVFTLRERAKPEKPGRAVSVVWDERLPFVENFKNRYSYIVRFTETNGKAGNHYHKQKQEIYYALHGVFTIVLEDVATKEREELQLKAGDNQFIYIPTSVAHVVISQTDDDILLVIASHPELSADELAYHVA